MVVRTSSGMGLLERFELFKTRVDRAEKKTKEEQEKASHEKKEKLRELSRSQRIQEEAKSKLALEVAMSSLRSTQRKLDRLKHLNHAEVVALCEKRARFFGWETSTSLGAFGISHRFELGRPDLLLRKKGRRICALEVKEFLASSTEVKRGVGQCLFNQLYDVDAYLVIPEKHRLLVLKADRWLGSLGLIVFHHSKDLSVVRGANIFKPT